MGRSLSCEDECSGTLPEGKVAVDIASIIQAIRHNRVRITDHADEETQSDRLSISEVFASVFPGEVIEEYPSDKPYPSCLVYGKTAEAESVHTVRAYNEKNQWVVLVTVYRPDPQRWIDFRRRRPSDASIQ
jgi:hypothetical protein